MDICGSSTASPPLGSIRAVDTITWARSRLKHVNAQIPKSRSQLVQAPKSILPAAFIEFDTQENAHAAHQRLVHHRPMQMGRHLGIRPNEILWQSLRMGWRERLFRRSFVYGFIVAAMIFWSLPTATISAASNVELLSKEMRFLRWINYLPKDLLKLLQGFVPALALTLWIGIVPALLRCKVTFGILLFPPLVILTSRQVCDVQAGVLSLTTVELFTQKSYFAFLVIQVFLVTSFTSVVSSIFPSILQNPFRTPNLLASSLPRASNFFFSFI